MAASDIYQMVETAAASAHIEMRIEIQNPEKMYQDVSHFVRDEATLDTMTKIQPIVKHTVMEHCPGKWTSIAYHNRGPRYGNIDQRPTVVVFITPGSIYSWEQFEERIFNVVQSARLPDEVELSVEILPGCISPRQIMENEDPIAYVELNELATIPSNGASIAPSLCMKEAGSLGAVVDYHPGDKSETVKCFLTSYHVVASGDPAGRRVNDNIGIGLNGRNVDCKIDIDYPAKYDANETKRFVTFRIAKDGDETGNDRAILKRLESITTAGPIGHVKYASGHQLNTAKRRMDWALVALKTPNPGNSMQNMLPSREKFTAQCFQGVPAYKVQPGDTISGTGDILKNTWYGKLGRTSQGTAAEYTRIKRTIAWDNGLVSDEYEFRTLHSGAQFARRGDSGSLVFNMRKEWVGMLIASDVYDETGFVTPVQDLIKDIEDKTGGTITLV